MVMAIGTMLHCVKPTPVRFDVANEFEQLGAQGGAIIPPNSCCGRKLLTSRRRSVFLAVVGYNYVDWEEGQVWDGFETIVGENACVFDELNEIPGAFDVEDSLMQ